jgi:hypothetical protein
MLRKDAERLATTQAERTLEAQINAARTAAGASLTVPAGGTVGQVLTKGVSGYSWQAASGGGASWTELEVDFGAAPVYGAEFVITDAAITAASKIQVLPCGKAATGRTADDWAWDGAAFAANPGTGSATCYAHFLPGPIVGRRKVQYSVGA